MIVDSKLQQLNSQAKFTTNTRGICQSYPAWSSIHYPAHQSSLVVVVMHHLASFTVSSPILKFLLEISLFTFYKASH